MLVHAAYPLTHTLYHACCTYEKDARKVAERSTLSGRAWVRLGGVVCVCALTRSPAVTLTHSLTSGGGSGRTPLSTRLPHTHLTPYTDANTTRWRTSGTIRCSVWWCVVCGVLSVYMCVCRCLVGVDATQQPSPPHTHRDIPSQAESNAKGQTRYWCTRYNRLIYTHFDRK